MYAHRNLNFVVRRNNLRILQAGAFLSVMVCAVMLGTLLSSGGSTTATLSDAAESPQTPTAAGTVPARPKAISENQVVSVSPAKESDVVRYYERETGRAFSVQLGTLKTSVLSDVRLPGFIHTYWLPFSSTVISKFQDPAGISYRSFDYQTKDTSTIGTDVTALAVAPDGRQIVYAQQAGDASELYVSESNGANPRKLFTTRAQNIRLDWPTKDSISLGSRRLDRTSGDVSIVDLQGAITAMLSNLENLEYAWSPEGSRLLYSYYTATQGVSLWVRDLTLGIDVPLGLATSAHKCAWHGSTLVITCGIPMNSSIGSAVPAERSSTIDDIVTLDMATGAQTRHYGGASSVLIGVISPLVSSTEHYFVFTNVFDGRLYMLPI